MACAAGRCWMGSAAARRSIARHSRGSVTLGRSAWTDPSSSRSISTRSSDPDGAVAVDALVVMEPRDGG